MRVIPLGVGDAFSARWYSSCLVVEHEGRCILVDCPHPIRKMLRESEAGVDLDRIEAVALTHLHADHSSGLEGYGYFTFFALQRRAVIAAHPPSVHRLWDGHLAAGMERLVTGDRPARRGFDDYFEHVALDAGAAVDVGPFSIECRPTRHHIATTAFRIRAGDRSIGYSADTAFDPALIEWLAEADVAIHETNYGSQHTPYAKLAELPAALRARMRLIHYPDDFDLAASTIEPLEQGRTYEVGPSTMRRIVSA